jgi:hypothetical protein
VDDRFGAMFIMVNREYVELASETPVTGERQQKREKTR